MTPSKDAAQPRARQRRLLVGLAALFFAPLAVAFYLYYGQSAWHPVRRVNHGDLIDPPRPLPAVVLPRFDTAASAGNSAPDLLRKKWTLLYVGDGACDERCKTQLYNSRQVRIALDRDMERVQRVFIARGACCDSTLLRTEHPDLIVLRETPAAAGLLALLPAYDGISPSAAERLYLVDPLGNLMMAYAPDAKPKGLLEDLKRLLRLSSVG